MRAEPRDQPTPIEPWATRANQVRHVVAIVPLALHYEGLRPDHLLGRAQPDRHPQHRGGHAVREPRVVDLGNANARAVDDVDAAAVDPRLPEPVGERPIGLEAVGRQRPQQADGVATADEHVEVLRAAHAAGIVCQRIVAADEERDAGPLHQQERPPVSPAAALRLAIRGRAGKRLRETGGSGAHERRSVDRAHGRPRPRASQP